MSEWKICASGCSMTKSTGLTTTLYGYTTQSDINCADIDCKVCTPMLHLCGNSCLKQYPEGDDGYCAHICGMKYAECIETAGCYNIGGEAVTKVITTLHKVDSKYQGLFWRIVEQPSSGTFKTYTNDSVTCAAEYYNGTEKFLTYAQLIKHNSSTMKPICCCPDYYTPANMDECAKRCVETEGDGSNEFYCMGNGIVDCGGYLACPQADILVTASYNTATQGQARYMLELGSLDPVYGKGNWVNRYWCDQYCIAPNDTSCSKGVYWPGGNTRIAKSQNPIVNTIKSIPLTTATQKDLDDIGLVFGAIPAGTIIDTKPTTDKSVSKTSLYKLTTSRNYTANNLEELKSNFRQNPDYETALLDQFSEIKDKFNKEDDNWLKILNDLISFSKLKMAPTLKVTFYNEDLESIAKAFVEELNKKFVNGECPACVRNSTYKKYYNLMIDFTLENIVKEAEDGKENQKEDFNVDEKTTEI